MLNQEIIKVVERPKTSRSRYNIGAGTGEQEVALAPINSR